MQDQVSKQFGRKLLSPWECHPWNWFVLEGGFVANREFCFIKMVIRHSQANMRKFLLIGKPLK